MKENYQVIDKETGAIHWISRSVAVLGILFGIDDQGEKHFLFEIRGEGCPDNVGKLCLVCGYLNWDESLTDALIRETFEETGYKIHEDQVKLWSINSDPTEAHQNVTIRYIVEVDYDDLKRAFEGGTINKNTSLRGGESNEVSGFKLLSSKQIRSIDSDEFAFNHKELIEKFLTSLTK